MNFRVTPFLLLALLAAGCGAQPVLLSVPLNRFESPEPGAEFHLSAAVAAENYLVLSPDLATTAPDPSSATVDQCPENSDDLFTDDPCGPLGSLGASFRPAQSLQLSLQANSGIVGGQAKLYVFGPAHGDGTPGSGSMAVTAAYGQSTSSVDSGSRRTRIERSMADVAVIFGQRLSPSALLYGGPFYSRHDYDGRYTHMVQTRAEDDSGSLVDDLVGGGSVDGGEEEEVTDDFGGTLDVLGANAGLHWQFGAARNYGLLAECAFAQFKGEGDSRSRARCGLAFEYGFGGPGP